MTQEFRTYGPPGTGKTTWLSHQVRNALVRYVPDVIFACSFTRAAALELAGRDLPLPRQNIGTIHSLCYQALGKPALIETDAELLEEWNVAYPGWEVQQKGLVLDEPAKNDQLQLWSRERAMLTGRMFPEEFAGAWEAFKHDHQAVDFTDLLLNAPESLGARVLFVDEAQDLTPLQWRVVRCWGADTETFVVVGDDDQLLYQFLGADAAAFLSPLPQKQKKYLRQSYRLPRAVQTVAQDWIARLGAEREPKEYKPRDAEGEARRRSCRLNVPGPLVAEVVDRVDSGQTVMLLASCSYLLQPVLRELRAMGVPFHNPYRPRRGDWNPLKRTTRRLAQFTRHGREVLGERDVWPAAEWWEWMAMLRAEHLQPGAKAEAQRMAISGLAVREPELIKWLTTAALDALERQDMRWLADRVTKQYDKVVEYPMRIAELSGPAALEEVPGLMIGTIHSVKGGEADVVYLFPDLSYEAWVALQREPGQHRAALIRQFYVGMTRAREALFLCAPSEKRFVNW